MCDCKNVDFHERSWKIQQLLSTRHMKNLDIVMLWILPLGRLGPQLHANLGRCYSQIPTLSKGIETDSTKLREQSVQPAELSMQKI